MSQLDATVLDRIMAFLAPLFLNADGSNPDKATAAAQAMLESYAPRTNRELRLAALSIAFAFGTLDSLKRSNEQDIPAADAIRLRANANALNRSAAQNEARYDKLRQASPDPAATADEPLPASASPADLLAFARSAVASMLATGQAAPAELPKPPKPQPATLSRQQRRLQEREAAKQVRREHEAERRAQVLAAFRGGSGAAAAPA